MKVAIIGSRHVKHPKIILKKIMQRPNGHVRAEAGGLSVPSGALGFGCGGTLSHRECT